MKVILDTLTKKNKSRIWELDFLRGFSILLMCIDHTFYDVRNMFSDWLYSSSSFARGFYYAAEFYLGVNDEPILLPLEAMQYSEYVFLWFILAVLVITLVVNLIKYKGKIEDEQSKNYITSFIIIALSISSMGIINKIFGFEVRSGTSVRAFIHPIILWIFFLLCGQSCRFSRSNIKRTVQISVCAALISLFTIVGEDILNMSGLAVRFGVLHMLSVCVLIYTLIEIICKLLIKNKESRKYVISFICLALAIVSYALDQYLWNIEDTIIRNNNLAWLHYVFSNGFASSDYFTVLENLPRVLFGASLAPFVYPKKQSLIPPLQPLNKGFVCFMGRHTLIVVLTHQLIIAGILFLIGLAF